MLAAAGSGGGLKGLTALNSRLMLVLIVIVMVAVEKEKKNPHRNGSRARREIAGLSAPIINTVQNRGKAKNATGTAAPHAILATELAVPWLLWCAAPQFCGCATPSISPNSVQS